MDSVEQRTKWFGTTLTLGAQYITLEETSITDSERKLVGPLPALVGQTTTHNYREREL